MLNEPGGTGFYGARGFNGDILVTQNYGFRGFRFEPEDDSLRSLVYDYVWDDGINHAVCARTTTWSRPPTGCPFPNKRCSHGFYAYYKEDYYPVSFNKAILLSGVINGFGRCVIGNDGYRSEYASLVALASPLRATNNLLRALDLTPTELSDRVTKAMERRFPTVPIFDTVEELRAVFPLTGRPPRNS